MKNYYLYIVTNKKHGTLYTGITDNLTRRIYEHKIGIFDSFTKKYNLSKLVYFEHMYDINATILREKRMKKWKREWKIKLIESLNPDWKDLYEGLIN
jgi:putative endonuclease